MEIFVAVLCGLSFSVFVGVGVWLSYAIPAWLSRAEAEGQDLREFVDVR